MSIAITLALSSALLKATQKVLHRYVLTTEDSLAYAFVWHALSTIMFLPFFAIEFAMPSNNKVFGLVVISSAIWPIVAYTGFKAYKHLEVSIKTPISKSKIIFALIFAVLFLKETLNIEKIIGTILIFIGIVVISYKHKSKFGSFKDKGVQLTLISSLLMATALLIDKFASAFFNPGMYSFMVFGLPTIFLLPFMRNKGPHIKSIFKNKFSATLSTMVLGSAAYYLLLWAFKHAEASVIIPIVELGTIFAVLGGIFFLGEKKDITKKLIASGIVILGAVLISGVISF